MKDNNFWLAIDKLINSSDIVIDRPKGSKHPVYNFIYKIDYGYLNNTKSQDGQEIDIWRGSLKGRGCNAVICTVDLIKRDSEIKILIDCSETEKKDIINFHNSFSMMKGIMINRYINED